MRLPGEALLEFQIESRGEQESTLHQMGLFKP
jgi:hypothetical protein